MNNFQNQFQPYQNRVFPNQFQSYTQTNSINWVNGIEGAKAWQLMPNSNVLLLDSENEGRFYIKVSDNVGMCSIRTFTYTESTNESTKNADVDFSQFVTRSELNEALSNLGGKKNGKQSISTTEPKPVISE